MLVYSCNKCGNVISFLHIEYKTEETPACIECGSNNYGNLHVHREEVELEPKLQETLKESIGKVMGNLVKNKRSLDPNIAKKVKENFMDLF